MSECQKLPPIMKLCMCGYYDKECYDDDDDEEDDDDDGDEDDGYERVP